LSTLNVQESVLLAKASTEAKEHRNAEKVEIWRDGKLVDVRVTKIYDREEVKKTQQ